MTSIGLALALVLVTATEIPPLCANEPCDVMWTVHWEGQMNRLHFDRQIDGLSADWGGGWGLVLDVAEQVCKRVTRPGALPLLNLLPLVPCGMLRVDAQCAPGSERGLERRQRYGWRCGWCKALKRVRGYRGTADKVVHRSTRIESGHAS